MRPLSARHQLWIAVCLAVLNWSCTWAERRGCDYLIPDGYVGWVRIDFLIPEAPQAPVLGDRYVYRFPKDGRIRT